MKIKTMLLTGVVALAFLCCKQEQQEDLNRILDLSITLDQKEIQSNGANYLNLSIENISSVPISFPVGVLVLEFTSYSGSIQRTIPLSDNIILESANWQESVDFILQTKEQINLKIDLGSIIYGSIDQASLSIPADSYAVNAYFAKSDGSEIIQIAEKVRSNYLYVSINSDHKELSLNE